MCLSLTLKSLRCAFFSPPPPVFVKLDLEISTASRSQNITSDDEMAGSMTNKQSKLMIRNRMVIRGLPKKFRDGGCIFFDNQCYSSRVTSLSKLSKAIDGIRL